MPIVKSAEKTLLVNRAPVVSSSERTRLLMTGAAPVGIWLVTPLGNASVKGPPCPAGVASVAVVTART